ncbi:glycosyltransferase family 2 protein [Candidatus Micrarchaeota archaeon]|nr:glycosyltransferase family 2 protein [Candidatus Micrarchaeota archaeon]MBU1930101.1 glycosyltransferase family 2 protein [Candidatus Micrarchaeota archaeon]
MPTKSSKSWSDVSIVVATFNNVATLKRTVQGLTELNYPSQFEIIVVNDGSTDSTRQMMKTEFEKNPRVVFIDFKKNQGVCKARNAGIQKARFPIVINMDHDCIPEKNWLQKMVAGFDSKKVGVVSAYGGYGGTSTGFRKELLEMVGGYDEEYRYYREDTDLTFKIMDLGFEFKLVKAGYEHDHVEAKPRGKMGFLRHVWKRLNYHQNDVLLWKKHPTKVCAKFLHVKFGFLVDPRTDFAVATGTWQEKGEFGLSSPRGITFLENKSPFHFVLIILGGLAYILAVKLFRLMASIKFKKLLV